MLVVASSLFLLAATSAPGDTAMDAISQISGDTADSPSPPPLFPETEADEKILAMTAVSTPDYVTMPVDQPASLSALIEAMGATATHAESRDDLDCLARAVYFEARGEPLEGQLAVAQAILNRVDSGLYPTSVCAVVRQPGQFTYSHTKKVKPGDAWRRAQAIAVVAAESMWPELVPDALSFHAVHVRPGWSGKVRVAQIGRHIFYR